MIKTNSQMISSVAGISSIFLVLILVSCTEEKPQHYLEQGTQLLEKGDLESARVQFQNALQLEPALSIASYQLALIDEQKQNWASMMSNLLQTVSSDPKHLDAQLKLGQIYLSAGQLDKAAAQAKIALQLKPNNLAVRLMKASIQFRKGENSKALQGISGVLKEQPLLADALEMQATILVMEKRVEEAITILQAGVEKKPGDRELRLLKMRLEIETKNIDEAVLDYAILVDQNPNDVRLHIYVADLLVNIGELGRAENALREAIKKHPKESALKLKFVVLVERRDVGLAEKLLTEYISETPKDATLKLRLAEVALLQKDMATVERLTEEVLNLDTNHSGALLLRAGMRLNSNDTDGAIADLRIVLRDQPDSEQAMILMAMASTSKGEGLVAESQWFKVLEINPNNRVALLSLVKELLKRDKYARAEEIAAKAVRANPKSLAPVELLIQLKVARKDWDGAQTAMDQLKKMPQGTAVAKYWQGVITALQGHTGEAINIYQEVLAVQPDYLPALMNLSQLYSAREDQSGLIAYLKTLIAKNPELASVQELLALSYIAEKKWAEAEKILRAASENNPANIDLKLKLVNVIELQSASRAETALKQFIQTQPHQVRLKFRLAGHYVGQKRYPEAGELLKEVVDFNPSGKDGLSARLKLSELAWVQNDRAEAKAILDELINRDSSYSEALIMRASMHMENQDANATVSDLNKVLNKQPDSNLSPDLKDAVDQLLYVTKLMIDRLTLNSSNSSIPPASDPNRKKNGVGNGDGDESANNKPGGQPGHPGKTLSLFENPDQVIDIPVDHALMQSGEVYKSAGYLRRQIVDITIQRVVTEYRAEILEDQDGNQLIADFPDKIKRQVQYGDNIKAQAIYLSQFQLLPYERVADFFRDQAQIPLSAGSIYNFNEQIYHALAGFEDWVKRQLLMAFLAHVDETSINVNGKKHWLHVICTDKLTFLFPHETRGLDANHSMGVLPDFNGNLCHDHWKAYFQFGSGHVLCNAHHLRELERAKEQDQQSWADALQAFLIEINIQVKENGGALNQEQADAVRKDYRDLLTVGESECPPPAENKESRKGKRGPVKRSKSRNLLERLINYEDEVLGFITDERIPFTNNQGERDLRMSKVQQKISGCFRSMQGAYNFARIRSYISTCIKNGVSATEALNLAVQGDLPTFMKEI